jgi:hypothetical protein
VSIHAKGSTVEKHSYNISIKLCLLNITKYSYETTTGNPSIFGDQQPSKIGRKQPKLGYFHRHWPIFGGNWLPWKLNLLKIRIFLATENNIIFAIFLLPKI